MKIRVKLIDYMLQGDGMDEVADCLPYYICERKFYISDILDMLNEDQ